MVCPVWPPQGRHPAQEAHTESALFPSCSGRRCAPAGALAVGPFNNALCQVLPLSGVGRSQLPRLPLGL